MDTVPEKVPGTDNEDDDEECMDWWTKYFASIDTMIEVSSVSVQLQFRDKTIPHELS